MEKRNYIRQCFKYFLINKKRLGEIFSPSVKGVDYSRVSCSSGTHENVQESAIIKYVDEKVELEKKISIVNKTMEHFRIEDKRYGGRGKANYIHCRFIRRMPYRRAAIDCNISERTALYWEEDIYYTAESIAEEYNLF